MDKPSTLAEKITQTLKSEKRDGKSFFDALTESEAHLTQAQGGGYMPAVAESKVTLAIR